MSTRLIRLSGQFTESAEPMTPGAASDKIDRDCLLVYMGEFQSMDGPVKIDLAHLERMVEVHNGLMSKIARMATGEIPLKYCPPIQLDHSTSAKDTVGRLVGELRLGKYDDENGEEKQGLYGKVRILGKENVEKVMDGRWTHVSIGADLDTGKITELTITPFPAADNASLMSKMSAPELEGWKNWESGGGDNFSRTIQIKKLPNGLFTYRIYDNWENEVVFDGSKKDTYQYNSESEAKTAARRNWEQHWKQAGKKLSKIQMPGNVDEAKWSEAKKAAHESYPDLTEKDDKFYAIVQSIYKKMAAGKVVKSLKDRGHKVEVYEAADEKFILFIDDYGENVLYDSVDQALVNSKVLVDNRVREDKIMEDQKRKGKLMKEKLKAFLMRFKRLSAEDAEKKMAEMPTEEEKHLAEEAEKHEKMKKHLMDHEKMADEDADKKLAEMKPEEKEELSKHMAEEEKVKAEMAAKELTEEEKKALSAEIAPKGEEARMKAAKEKMIALHKGIKTGLQSHGESVRLTGIVAKLQKLQSQAKITPAEMKKIDIARLAKCNDATVTEVLNSYEKRESVIIPIMLSTTKAEQISEVQKKYRLQIAEIESRLNMPSKREGAQKELARLKRMQEAEEKEVNVHIDTTPHTHYEMAYDALCKMLDEGHDKERVKSAMREHMKKMMDEALKGKMAEAEPVKPITIDEAKMSSLAESAKLLQNQFSELTELMSGAMGIQASELNQGGN